MIKDHIEEIKKMYINDKMSSYEISLKFGCSARHIQRVLDEDNIARRTKAEAFRIALFKGRVKYARSGIKRKYLSKETRWKIMAEDKLRCTLCNFKGKSFAYLTIDHIVPVFAGGTDERSNLRTLCWNCQQAKRIMNNENGGMKSGIK